MLTSRNSFIWILLLALPAFSQGDRGAITGMVRDPAGALVAGAELVATNLQTNVVARTTTTETGVYRIPQLPPGQYEIAATCDGFKRGVISPATVTVGGVVTADFALELGVNTQSVTVEADTLALETSTSDVTRSITSADYRTWPIQVSGGMRQLQAFVFASLPGAVGSTWQGSINGGQYFSHDILIEGMSIGRMDIQGGSNTELSLSADAVNEFKLQGGAVGAQYGGTQAGLANFNVRSGTNDIHGTAFEYFTSDFLNARTFTQNATGAKVMPQHENNWGATLGGPVRIPKLYDGRNRTFFFFTYEGDQRRRYSLGSFVSLPTADFKNGNFSRLLDPSFTLDPKSGTQVGVDPLGRPVIYGAIYDPKTTRSVNGKMVRDPFPGNVIPSSAFSAVTKNVLGAGSIPEPTGDKLVGNYPALGGAPLLATDSIGGKLDQVINQAHRLSFFLNLNHLDELGGVPTGYLPMPGSVLGPFRSKKRVGNLARVTEDWVIGPTLLNHFGIGYNRFTNYQLSVSADEDWPNRLGLTGVGPQTMPSINFSAASPTLGGQMAPIAASHYGGGANGSTIVQNDLSWLRGSHNLRFGAEVRKYYYNERPLWGASGSFSFASDQTGLPAFASQTGFSFASFMLGAVKNSDVSIYTLNPGHRVWAPAFYVSDDWRVNKRLTINAGLRWDIVGGVYEVTGRSSAFDPTLPNPGANNVPGAIRFLEGTGQTSFQDPYYGGLGPRLGFAYQLKSSIVLRGGYGISYSPPVQNGYGYGDNFGYNASNPVPANADGSAAYYWDNGHPPYTKSLPSKDPAIQNYASALYIPRDSTRMPYVQNWNMGLQFMLPSDTVLDVTYLGNKGTRLRNPAYANMQQLDPKYLALGTTLLANPKDHPQYMPYASYPTSGGLAYIEYALRPYPQYNGLTNMAPLWGNSSYNALQIQATKRMSNGLSYLLAYSWSKAITDSDSSLGDGVVVNAQNQYNRRAERSVAAFNYPQNLKLTWVYELPFGSGKRFLNRGGMVHALAGGWRITGNQEYRSGDPLVPTSGRNGSFMGAGVIRPNIVTGVPLVQDAGGVDTKNGTPYLNPAAFSVVPAFFGNMAGGFGNAPRILPNVRGPRSENENFGVSKQVTIHEDKHVELRADFFNALNRAGRGNPVMNVSSAQFGRIYGPHPIHASAPRTIQLQLRFNY